MRWRVTSDSRDRYRVSGTAEDWIGPRKVHRTVTGRQAATRETAPLRRTRCLLAIGPGQAPDELLGDLAGERMPREDPAGGDHDPARSDHRDRCQPAGTLPGRGPGPGHPESLAAGLPPGEEELLAASGDEGFPEW